MTNKNFWLFCIIFNSFCTGFDLSAGDTGWEVWSALMTVLCIVNYTWACNREDQ